MKKLMFLVLFLSFQTFAALNMTPGLWELDVKIKAKGVESDPRAEIQKALAKMPEAQRKKMEAMMASMGAGISSNGAIKVCYSEEMLKKDTLAPDDKFKKCKTNIVTKTAQKMVTDFICEDGTKGKATWKVESKEKLKGLVEMTKKGEDSKINYTGKFVNKSCGAIKPIL